MQRCMGIAVALALGCGGGGGAGRDDAGAVDAATTDALVPPIPTRDHPYDFDGDGLGDLIVGDPEHAGGAGAVWMFGRDEEAAVRLGHGEPLSRLGEHVFWIGDRDGDGRFEVGALRASRGSSISGRWFGSAGGGGELTYETHASDVISSPPMSVEADDDDVPDLVVTFGCTPRCSSRALVTAEGTRTLEWPFVVLDLDGDVRRELLELDAEGALVVPRGLQAPELGGVGTIVSLGVAGDVDGDRRDDLFVVGTLGTALVRWHAEAVIVSLHSAALLPLGVDLDCDGFDDFVEDFDIWRGGVEGVTDFGLLSARPTFHVTSGVGAPDLDGDGCRERVDPTSLVVFSPRLGPNWPSWGLSLPSTWRRPLPFLAWRSLLDRHDPYATIETSALGELPFSDGDLADGERWFGYLEVRRTRTSGPGVGTWTRGSFVGESGQDALVFLGGDIDGDGTEDFASLVEGRVQVPGLPSPAEPVMEVRRAGDLDGDGRVDLLGYARAMMISPRTLVWLAKDLVDGDTTAHAVLEGWAEAAADVDDDGFDDLIAQEGASVWLHRGSVEGLRSPAHVMVPPGTHVSRRGLAMQLDEEGVSFARLTAEGLRPFGEPLATPLAPGSGEWILARDDFPLAYLPEAHPDGGLVIRVEPDLTRSVVVAVPHARRSVAVLGMR